ncbi:MAG: DUF6036 family nucleotidyltransferase [Planctomycetota bacterium]|jgi:uncharacterized protein (DUF1330 family)
MLGWMSQALRALNDAGVRYLVVGGVAVVLHGHLRTTADLDVVLALEEDNLRAAMAAFEAAGYQPRVPVRLADFADEATRESWVRDEGMLVFALWNPAIPGSHIDLFIEEPFDFAAEFARAPRVPTDAVTIPVLHTEALLAMKRAAGRPQDVADCEALELLRAAADEADNEDHAGT